MEAEPVDGNDRAENVAGRMERMGERLGLAAFREGALAVHRRAAPPLFARQQPRDLDDDVAGDDGEDDDEIGEFVGELVFDVPNHRRARPVARNPIVPQVAIAARALNRNADGNHDAIGNNNNEDPSLNANPAPNVNVNPPRERQLRDHFFAMLEEWDDL